ncbi:MAG: ROK family protein [Pleomorphochaeta sp.]
MPYTRNSPYNKHYNRLLVIRNLLKKNCSRVELSRLTGLTRASITNIVDFLIKDGVIKEIGEDINNNVVGRNPISLEIIPTRYDIISIDITRSNCFIGILNLGGEIIYSQEANIKNAKTPGEAVEIISDEIKSNIIPLISNSDILGIGITTPGPVNTQFGIIGEIIDFDLWKGFNIVKEFKKYFSYEIILERDANGIALAELYYGAGRNYDDFLCIMSYSGIGFGIIKNRQLYRGKFGLTPELGHISIDFNGKPCECGNKGCLYQYYGIKKILNKVNIDFPEITSWEEIVDRAYLGEKYFINTINYYANIFSIAIISAINIAVLDKVILSGFITYKPDLFINSVKKNIKDSYLMKDFFDIELIFTNLTNKGSLIGGATAVIDYAFTKYK